MAFEVEHGSAGPLSSSASIRGFKNGRFATFSGGSNRVVAIGNPRPAPADGLDTGIPCLGTKSASGAAHASPGQRPRIRPSRNQPSPERARQPMVHAPMPGLARPFRTPGVFWGAGTRVVAPREHGHAPLGRRVLGRGAWVPCRDLRPPTRCHSISTPPSRDGMRSGVLSPLRSDSIGSGGLARSASQSPPSQPNRVVWHGLRTALVQGNRGSETTRHALRVTLADGAKGVDSLPFRVFRASVRGHPPAHRGGLWGRTLTEARGPEKSRRNPHILRVFVSLREPPPHGGHGQFVGAGHGALAGCHATWTGGTPHQPAWIRPVASRTQPSEGRR